ncbi:AMP-binding protein [Micromonospora lutea]|uniref:AMP-dependent synthetase/ligase domain-containing protein n=1 Tax=Micromonospora lutea TaxID=419825 RepID=A0ABQ4IT21_9ACTN|nr:AMP-binding protein [Micromonospora lutea]GIJ21053.1 hypothetical protein Vlu01_16770 [Micromonospora lutea]
MDGIAITRSNASSQNDQPALACRTLAWLVDPPTDRGVHFATDDEWTFHSYARLSTLVSQAAARLRAAGVREGDVVPIACGSSPTFIAAFFGALLLGASPSALAPPGRSSGDGGYLDRFVTLVRATGGQTLVTTADLASTFEPAATAAGVTLLADVTDGDTPLTDPILAPRNAMVQFSSGSTGTPRGVRISMSALDAQVTMLRDWMSFTEADAYASWLPLHHDMGLVGCLLFPMAYRADVLLMRPEQFVRSPLRWLQAFSTHGTTAATPPFGLSHVLRRVRPAQLRGLDFSGWRTLIVGAERVDNAALRAFGELLAPAGFRPDALLPAYGLAEATLAVTGARHGGPRSLTVDVDSLRPGQRVQPVDPSSPRSMTLTACGGPLSGVRLGIVDDDGRPLGVDMLGEITVGGDALADGYIVDGVLTSFHDPIRTGDAGFLHDGELYVVGRFGDATKILGRWLFAEDVERAAVALSPAPGRTVALVGEWDGDVTAVIVIEGDLGAEAGAIGTAARAKADAARVRVVTVDTGWISRTTSGKPQRRAMWQRLISEDHGITLRWDSADV